MPRDLFAEQEPVQKRSPRDLFAQEAANDTPKPETSFTDRATAMKRGADLGFSKAKIGAARLVLDAMESAGVDVSKAQEALDTAFDFSKELTPEISGTEPQRKAGEFIGENAPFAVLPGGAGKTLLTTGLKSAAIGGGVGAAQFVDEGESRVENVATGTLVGLGLPIVFRGVEKAVSKVIGSRIKVLNDDGSFTDEAVTKLREVGESPNNIIDLEFERLKRQGALSPEEVERFNQFKAEGINPTRAEVTQRADDFQFQQEQAKTSGVIRDRLNETNRTLLDKGDELTSKTGIDTESAFSTGESVLGAIDEKALAVDAKIQHIYKEAKDNLPDKVFRLDRFIKKADEILKTDLEAGKDVASSALEMLRFRGGLDPQRLVTSKKTLLSKMEGGEITVGKAEEIRQGLNGLYDGATARSKIAIRRLKESLDLDVCKAVSKDAFLKARKAHSESRRQLERLQRTKFDKNTKSTLLDLLEGKINPDQLFERVVLQKSTPRADIARLRLFLTKGEGVKAGTQAWNNLRGETVRWIFKQSSSGKNDLGDAVLTGTKLNKSIERIGKEKLNILLTKPEFNALIRLQKISNLRTPVNGTALGKGPSAQAIAAVGRKFPILREITEAVSASRKAFKSRKAINPEAGTVKALSKPERLTLPRPTGVTAAGATGEEF